MGTFTSGTQLLKSFYHVIATVVYRSGAICRTLSNNIVASSVWRDDHEAVHCVTNCQNSSVMLTPCACVEKLNTRVVNHTCKKNTLVTIIFTSKN